MKIVEQYPFKFADAIFEIYWTDARILVLPLRQLCDALGLSFSGQLQRLKREPILAKHLHTVRVMVTRVSDGVTSEQEVACLGFRRLDYWLGTVDHTRVKPELRDKLILFKEEMADAVHAYFRTRRLPEDVLAELDATLPADQRQFHHLMDQASALKEQVGEHGVKIKGLDERVSALEARLVGTDFISHQEAQQYLAAVAALGDLMKARNPKKATPYAVIHNEVKRQFGVPSYQLLPEKDFGKVMEFLARWWAREAPDRPVPQIFLVRQERLI